MGTIARAVVAAGLGVTLLAGCSGRRGRGERPMVSRDAGTLPGMDAGAATDGGGGEEDAGGGGDPIRGCFQTCTTVDDCVSSAPTNDADNYECIAGVCEYLGCNSDTECSDTFDGDYRCVPTGDFTGCVQACATVDDCVSSAPTNDADNYECVGGLCEYLGCNSDTECSDTFDGEYTCRAP